MRSGAPATLEDLIRDASRRLAEAGLDTARLDARVLAAAATGLDRAGLIAEGSNPADPGIAARLGAMVERRMLGEPVARIVGHKEFWSLDFLLGPESLVPRPDSETLVAAVLEEIDVGPGRSAPLRIVDLGTGSGCLLVALLTELPSAFGIGVDISEATLRIACQNAHRHGVAARAGFVCGRWSEPIAGGIDILLSNPPYIPTGEIGGLAPEVARHDPLAALDGGPDGLRAYRQILADCRRVVVAGGRVALEVGRGQADEVSKLAGAEGLRVLRIAADLATVGRVVVAEVP
ncbi:release factor glutamine methyltransferase [Tepidamorphus gemmatus]|uniref:Release factor glutamine methyltransferase n=1 Tax=Tepidamorphus gemmatus TaxID=747076 RepID=A0A4R3M3Y8_9HYPH|nr:peptide chain release factor N(5)-glutamine methyltransferase [Tepidamorphus gemmatus]TCT05895.1 release factor glutamine methyltransferase [Tepidamorphus gemmatus]